MDYVFYLVTQSVLGKDCHKFSVATGRDYQPQVSTAKIRLLGLLPCFIKVYPEVSKSVKFSSFQGLTEIQAAMLADEEGVEFVGASWEVQEDGEPLLDLEVKHVSDDIKIRVEAVAPEEFSVVGWHKSVLLEDCDFMQHRTRVSVTRLREMGLIGNDEDVTSLGDAGFDEDDSSEEELARDEEVSEQRMFRENNPVQKEMWRVVVKDIIARVDEDGDGIAERRRFIRIGNTIRYDEIIAHTAYLRLSSCPTVSSVSPPTTLWANGSMYSLHCCDRHSTTSI
jgi:hypothetical protein